MENVAESLRKGVLQKAPLERRVGVDELAERQDRVHGQVAEQRDGLEFARVNLLDPESRSEPSNP